ncbi:MAG: DUF4333 domain-containing protein [Pseudonocardiaceae bacterium]
MSTPYGPSGSPEPTQRGQQPPGEGYPGTPPGGFPVQDPNWGYQQGYPPPSYDPQGYGPPPGYGPQGYGPPPGYDPQGYPPPGYDQWQQPYGGYQDHGQQSGQPPYPGGYGQPAGEAPGKKSTLPWMLTGVGGVILASIIFLGFVTPGFFTTTVFDRVAVQEGVQRILSDEYGQNTQAVTCPGDQEVQTGSRFTCQATIDGAQHDVTITVKTDAGEYEVGRPS